MGLVVILANLLMILRQIGLLNQSDVKDLQGDLDRLNEWEVKQQMDFNIDKCKVMNIGKENP